MIGMRWLQRKSDVLYIIKKASSELSKLLLCTIKASTKKMLSGRIVAVANVEENHRYALELVIHASVESTMNFGYD